MSEEDIGSGYHPILMLSPVRRLARTCYSLLTVCIDTIYAVCTVLIKFSCKCFEIVRAILQTTSKSVSLKTQSTKKPLAEGGRHYILDLRPETDSRPRKHKDDQERRRRKSCPLTFGGYSIPTIALANVSQLAMTTLTKFSYSCVNIIVEMVLMVIGATQLQVKQSDNEEAKEEPDTVVQNHYIFDLRPQYGSDITEMLNNVLDNVLKSNWPATVKPYIRTYRKRSKRRFVFMSGWRPKLLNKKQTRKTLHLANSVNCKQSEQLSSNSVNGCLQSEEQFGISLTPQNTDRDIDMEEKLVMRLPVQATDHDTDIQMPACRRQTYVT